MTELWPLARKDLQLLLRDRAGFFFTFFWPVVMAMFFGSIFGGGASGPRTIGLLVVDTDGSEASGRLVAELEGYPELAVRRIDDVAAARALVRGGEVPAFLVIPEDFGARQQGRFLAGAPSVELHTDPSRFAEAGMLEGLLLRAGGALLQDAFTQPGRLGAMAESNLRVLESGPPFVGREEIGGLLRSLRALSDAGLAPSATEGPGVGALTPLQVERTEVRADAEPRRPANPFAVSFAQALLWAMLGCAASFGISLAMERSQGTLVRLRIAPLRALDILGGKALACLLTSVAMSVLLLALAVVAFGVRPLSWPLLALAVACNAICFVGIMMLLSVLGRSERAAAGIGWAILLILAMIGGGMVPLFIMPGWMRALSDLSPVKWGILAVEGAVWRGFGPAEMLVPCLVLLAVGAVSFALGVRLFRWGDAG